MDNCNSCLFLNWVQNGWFTDFMKYLRFQHVQTDIPYSLNFCLFKNDIALVVCVALVNTCPFSIKIILYTIFSFINSWTTAQLARPSMVQMPIQLPTPLAHCRPNSFSGKGIFVCLVVVLFVCLFVCLFVSVLCCLFVGDVVCLFGCFYCLFDVCLFVCLFVCCVVLCNK
jgi:hypothetical protein